jgi:hypothetical protein
VHPCTGWWCLSVVLLQIGASSRDASVDLSLGSGSQATWRGKHCRTSVHRGWRRELGEALTSAGPGADLSDLLSPQRRSLSLLCRTYDARDRQMLPMLLAVCRHIITRREGDALDFTHKWRANQDDVLWHSCRLCSLAVATLRHQRCSFNPIQTNQFASFVSLLPLSARGQCQKRAE